MQGDGLYWSLAYMLNKLVWRGEILNAQDLPKEYPVVFVSNHAAALGPIAVTSSLSIRLYPWVIGDMLDWNKAASYLRRDFVEPQLYVPPSLSHLVSKIISQFSVRLLRTIGCIPVWQGEELLETYRQSVDALMQGKSLLIFPEDPAQDMDHVYEMTPFYKGFTRLGEIYYERTQKILQFYPLAVHPVKREIKVGKPITFDPSNNHIDERLRLKHDLESAIHTLYLSIPAEGHINIPVLH